MSLAIAIRINVINYASCEDATQSHVFVVEFQINPTYKYFEITVVTGNVAHLEAKLAHQVILLAVPLSSILIMSF